MASSDTLTVLTLSHLVPFLPFFSVIPEICRKLERNERKAKREQVLQLASFLEYSSKELLTLWLSDQIYELVKKEETAIDSLRITLETIEKKNEQ